MKTTTLIKWLGSALLLLGLTTAALPSAHAAGRAIERSLQEWLDVQGTFAAPRPWVPNTPRIFGLVNNPDRNGDGTPDAGPFYLVWFDYAGVLSRPGSTGGGTLGPASITGRATEMPLGDGTSIVTVHLNIKGALCWVALRNQSPIGETVLGHFETDVAAGAPAAYADVNYLIEFRHPTGKPFIDLIETFGNGDWTGFRLSLRADGPLTEFFDPNIEAGTWGRLTWGKPGLQDSHANANASNGAASFYPNDQFHLGPVGQR